MVKFSSQWNDQKVVWIFFQLVARLNQLKDRENENFAAQNYTQLNSRHFWSTDTVFSGSPCISGHLIKKFGLDSNSFATFDFDKRFQAVMSKY